MMFRKLFLLLVVVFVWALAHTASADLVGFWEFEDAAGGVIEDSSGNGYNGVIVGDAAVVTDPVRGQVLRNVAGGSVDLFNVPKPIPAFAANSSITLAAWVKPEAASTSNYDYIIDLGSDGDNPLVNLCILPDGRVRSYSETDQPGGNKDQVDLTSDSVVEVGAFVNWHHIAVVYDRVTDKGKFYIDGLADSATLDISLLEDGYAFTWPAVHFGANQDNVRQYIGLMDDVAVFDHALTEAEIQVVMQGFNRELAGNPQPEDAVVDLPRDVTLSWEPGEFAVKHDVYFGPTFADVNTADRDNPLNVLVSQSQNANSYDAGVLELGQTYYWRVDEVNGAPDNTIFKGEVWSFTVEPLSYAIEGVMVTSNGTPDGDVDPENMVNGSGLNADDQHSVESSDMWLASPAGDEPLTVTFEFDRVYKMHEMLVWNYNVQFELMLGFGVKDATVEYSADGAEWVTLGDVVLVQATATADYATPTIVDLQGVAAQSVRLTINSGYGTQGKFGLSEVRFMQIPTHAREPQPADEAADVAVSDTVLSWRAGREAVTHEVYLSTDPDALELIDTTTEPSYAATLDLASTYYWQIVEVNNAEAISAWAGEVWTFSTEEYIVIEDFESYADDIGTGEAIFLTWVDGYEVPGNSSQVGYLEAPFAEETIVRGGSQSMPLIYDNTNGVTVSEATRTFATPQDWSTNGIETLTLFFRGQLDNTGQLYAKINGVKVPYDGGAEGVRRVTWQTWNIDLASLGTDLTNVQTLVIGIEGANVSGTLFVDDIHLYKVAPVAPREPDSAHLVAHYAFEDDATDSSGNGHDGEILGDAGFVAGMAGQALALDGGDDCVRIPNDDRLNPGAGNFSFTLWAQLDLSPSMTGSAAWDLAICKRDTGSIGYYIGANRDQGETSEAGFKFMVGSTARVDTPFLLAPLGEWVFVSAVLDRDQNVHKISVNGGSTWATATPASGPIAPAQDLSVGFDIGLDNYRFHGTIDEVRLYDTALTDAEVMWLANDL